MTDRPEGAGWNARNIQPRVEFDEQQWHDHGCPTLESAFVGLVKAETENRNLRAQVFKLNHHHEALLAINGRAEAAEAEVARLTTEANAREARISGLKSLKEAVETENFELREEARRFAELLYNPQIRSGIDPHTITGKGLLRDIERLLSAWENSRTPGAPNGG